LALLPDTFQRENGVQFGLFLCHQLVIFWHWRVIQRDQIHAWPLGLMSHSGVVEPAWLHFDEALERLSMLGEKFACCFIPLYQAVNGGRVHATLFGDGFYFGIADSRISPVCGL
jgi:hypothetical protein